MIMQSIQIFAEGTQKFLSLKTKNQQEKVIEFQSQRWYEIFKLVAICHDFGGAL